MRRNIGVAGMGLLLAVGGAGIGGCTSYYKVTDPTTGKVYYTTKLDHKSSGAATLTDARTGNRINLQNSEVEQIKKEQFESGKATPPSSS